MTASANTSAGSASGSASTSVSTSVSLGDSEYEAVIGLECHVQLQTQSKVFTGASAAYGGEPNSHIDPYTLGLPGSLPVLNRRAVEYALRMGLACDCKIALRSEFSRKHYFYPDLPKGYQISQFDRPICEGGRIEFVLHGEKRSVRLERIHMEEDAGKNTHAPGGRSSLIDYNRAGVPLIEIVSRPDIRSAEEAGEYLRAIRQMVRFLGISDGNMEEGSLRCDANVSIRRRGTEPYGTKTELKNINSFKFVQKAIEHEVARQIDIVRSGGKVVMETRGWDAQRGTSRSQRSKERAHDYRYLPDPDLPPLVIDPAWLESVRASLPETPMQRRERLITRLGLSPYDAGVLTSEKELCDFFDAALGAAGVPAEPARASGGSVADPIAIDGLSADHKARAKLCSSWLAVELLGALNRDGRGLSESKITPAALGELVALVHEQVISGRQAKEVFARQYDTGEPPRQIVAALGLTQITDPAVIEEAARRVVFDPQNARQREGYKKNPKLLGFFVGKVLAETGGKARPDLVSEVVLKLLG